MYIYRELEKKILNLFDNGDKPQGAILTGIVGCGKTTFIEHILELLKSKYKIFVFTGDDAQFRKNIWEDSFFLLKNVAEKTTEKSLIFIDEVQKCEDVFDALKLAFDKGNISFIVSGSNPAYLSTIAKKRLQRRANQILMLPFSLQEIFLHEKIFKASDLEIFLKIIWQFESIDEIEIPRVTKTDFMDKILLEFFRSGGLPLAYFKKKIDDKLEEIRKTVERGFELMSVDNNSTADLVRIELAKLNSLEFSYKNILEKTRLRQRDAINQIIDQLINHGYLVKRKPLLLEENKTSYLSIFSYIDPGIVSYLTGDYQNSNFVGSKVEGYVHTRLSYLCYNSVRKTELGYYKPYILDGNGNIRYQTGEVDFLLINGSRTIPIEVKESSNLSNGDLKPLTRFMKERKSKYGVVLYGGVPYKDQKNKLIFWPYWLI